MDIVFGPEGKFDEVYLYACAPSKTESIFRTYTETF